MNLEERIGLMTRLGNYLKEENNEILEAVKQKAFIQNRWFTIEFINHAIDNICNHFLDEKKLRDWAAHYFLNDSIDAKNIGVVMAGNIPLVGFHDFLCIFISGHKQIIKFSEKDEVLFKHIIDILSQWDKRVPAMVSFADRLAGCDAYIATGSNNTSRYFEYYFGKYPSIIRKNKTSIALLSGEESEQELSQLADDVLLYFGLGCRNVTKIYVPENYDFVPLINAFKKYNYLSDHTKYRNNYDYNLALLIMNNQYYMSSESLVLVENETIFSPVSVLYYSFYENNEKIKAALPLIENVQTIVGSGFTPFGKAQSPSLREYADGVDVMQFLLSL